MNRTLFRTRIKFCGMTRVGDVRLAGEMGADAVGFVFAPGNPRRLQVPEARTLRQALAPLVDAVAVFRDNSVEEVREVVRHIKPGLLQFQGAEDDGFCRSFGIPYIKSIYIGDGIERDAVALQLQYPAASAFVLDARNRDPAANDVPRKDWSRLPTGLGKPFMLAGGLDANNVFSAIQDTLPWGVEVCSAIEYAPGLKDGNKMRGFVSEVRHADCADQNDAAEQADGCSACGR